MAVSSEIRRGLWPDTIDELHLVKKSSRPSGGSRARGGRRCPLGASRFFAWPDARGVPWREVLRENARREFEEARFERDPEVVTRLLIGGPDAVQKALDKLVEGRAAKGWRREMID
ncbi:hypothetical protein BHM03_00057892 [Ensete ventricosum]|nr:hypothetical protein BHM03_00057892 [Ensete ventricosum]